MVKRKRSLASKASGAGSTLPFGVLMLASKASSTGSTPVQCPFFSIYFHYIAHCPAHKQFFWKRSQRDRSSIRTKSFTCAWHQCPLALVTKFAFTTPHSAGLCYHRSVGATDWLGPATRVGGSHGSFAPIPANQGLFAPLVLIMMIETEICAANVRRKAIPSSIPFLLTFLFLNVDSDLHRWHFSDYYRTSF